MAKFWQWLVLFAASAAGNAFFKVLNRLDVEGVPQNFRHAAGGSTVFYANHRSYADPFVILFGCLIRPANFFTGNNPAVWSVAYSGRLNGWKRHLIKPGRVIAHTPWGTDTDRKMAAVIKRGGHLLIFPEGRIHLGRDNADLAPFKRGLGWVVKNHDVDVVPIAVAGTDRLLPRGCRLPRLGRRVKVAFGQPLPSAMWRGKTTAEITSDLEERLKSLLRATA